MATIKDVAKKAGVSTATVSYVINKSRRVNPDTAKKVSQAIQDLNYHPNRIAQSLVTKNTQILSVLISDITDPFFAPIVRGIEDVAVKAGYIVMVCNNDEDSSKTKRYLESISQYRVDGIVISPTSGIEDLKVDLKEMDIPTVFVNRRCAELEADLVESDNELGAYMAIRHLLDLGHTRIGTIIGPTTVSTYADRLAGCKRAFVEAGVHADPSLLKTGGFHPDSAYQMAKELFTGPNKPTAVFVGSGRLSRGAYQAFREMGLRIPERLSLVTFDDTEWTTLVTPSLTTVSQQTYQMGKMAAEILVERIKKRNAQLLLWPDEETQKLEAVSFEHRKLRPELMVRSSTSRLQQFAEGG